MSDEKIITPHGELRISDETSKHDLVVNFDVEGEQRSKGFLGFFKRTP